ncbi:hypothetical protein [Treponema pedis]|uniref:hypothetical protein n=1 Tax=Treponema pedis TaxID=409322 RepID=UPI00040FA017|nr:hypothetical protein [Treponema pedis]
MPLNKSTGNMYDFITHTWNRIKVHASGYDAVYFNFFAPKKIWENHKVNTKTKIETIKNRLNNIGLPYVVSKRDFYILKEDCRDENRNFKLLYSFLSEKERMLFYSGISDNNDEKKEIFNITLKNILRSKK